MHIFLCLSSNNAYFKSRTNFRILFYMHIPSLPIFQLCTIFSSARSVFVYIILNLCSFFSSISYFPSIHIFYLFLFYILISSYFHSCLYSMSAYIPSMSIFYLWLFVTYLPLMSYLCTSSTFFSRLCLFSISTCFLIIHICYLCLFSISICVASVLLFHLCPYSIYPIFHLCLYSIYAYIPPIYVYIHAVRLSS